MLGLICYRESDMPPVRRVGGVRFRAVYVPRGTGLPARLRADAAARTLCREDIREAVFPPDYPQRERFARRGVAGVPLTPLHRATAPAIVRCCMAQQGIEPKRAVVAFAAERMTPELRRLIAALSTEVRYVVLAVAFGGEELARELRRELGIAARIAASGEPLCADLTVCFDPCGAAGAVLPLYAPALKVEYDSELPNELLAALWRAGALDAEKLTVKAVETTAADTACGALHQDPCAMRDKMIK